MSEQIGIRPAAPIVDAEIERELSELNVSVMLKFVRSVDARTEFLNHYERWLFANPRFQIRGLQTFQKFATNGTTGAFHDFYQIHHQRRIRVRRGEYPYHHEFFRSVGRYCTFLDQGPLEENDMLALSWPFSGNGEVQSPEALLQECEAKKIPVMLDCAFWGLSKDCNLDLTPFSCVEIVTFSLSKFFNLGHFRVGLMYTRQNRASAAILNPWGYTNLWGAAAALKVLRNFPIHYMTDKYRKTQIQICEKAALIPSDTLLFGIGDEKWSAFSRNNLYNRVCIAPEIAKAHLGSQVSRFISPQLE